jgi:hypothetical protein
MNVFDDFKILDTFSFLTPSRNTALKKASRRQNCEMGSLPRAVAKKKAGHPHTNVSLFDRTLHYLHGTD